MSFSEENEFVIRILRHFLRQKPLIASDELFSAINWDKLIAFAAHQNILTIIYYVLSKEQLLGKIPSEKRNELEKDFIGKAAFTLQYESLLREISTSFYQEGIPFVIIKGPTIALELYKPSDVRPYGDLDLLIKSQDYVKAKELLSKHEFRMAHPETESHRRTYWNSVDFYLASNQKIAIDLHWDTLMTSWGRNFFTDQEIWKHIRYLEFYGTRLPVLNPIVLIPHLCLHLAFHHQFGKLQTLCDLDLAVQKFNSDVDWEKMLEMSYEMKIWRAMIFSLRLSENLLGTEFPSAIKRALKRKTLTEKLFPFSYLVFRSTEIPAMAGRVIRFLLIDDIPGKMKSLVSFYKRHNSLRSA